MAQLVIDNLEGAFQLVRTYRGSVNQDVSFQIPFVGPCTLDGFNITTSGGIIAERGAGPVTKTYRFPGDPPFEDHGFGVNMLNNVDISTPNPPNQGWWLFADYPPGGVGGTGSEPRWTDVMMMNPDPYEGIIGFGTLEAFLNDPNGGILRSIAVWTAFIGRPEDYVIVRVDRIRLNVYYTPGPPPPPPPGGDGGVDGVAIESDGPRAFIHHGSGAKIRTVFSQDPATQAFISADLGVDKWTRIRCDTRRGLLFCLGHSGTTYKVFVSEDGGQTVAQKYSVTATSARLELDSETGRLLLLYEDSGAANKDVFRDGSIDGGDTWEGASLALGQGNAFLAFSGSLLDLAYDPRRGITFLTFNRGSGIGFTIWRSEDFGKTFG